MLHAIKYLGDLDLNHGLLNGESKQYLHRDGNPRDVVPPSDKVDGIVFARMQGGAQEFAVMAGHVVVDSPVALEPERHSDGKGYGPNPTTFGTDSAKRLLQDMAAANPGQASRLAELVLQL